VNDDQAWQQIADVLRVKPAYWAMQELNATDLAHYLLPVVRALIADELDSVANGLMNDREQAWVQARATALRETQP